MATYGFTRKDVSPGLVAYVIGKVGDVDTQVIGLVGPGTSRELSAQWEAPFQSDTLQSMVERSYGKFGQSVIQGGMMATGTTSVTTYNTKLAWTGGSHSMNLVLKFMAFSDPEIEVMRALMTLEAFASADPALKPAVTGTIRGRTPELVTVNVGRVAIFSPMVIESVSVPLDKEKDSLGRLIRAEVTLALKPYEIVPRSSIDATYGSP